MSVFETESKCRLLTIPASHFCEKARWGLERAGISFVEERHLPGFHLFRAVLIARQTTVPVLRAPGLVLGQSTQILRYSDLKLSEGEKLFPQEIGNLVAQLTDELDRGLGVAGRLWLYSYLLDKPFLLCKMSSDHPVPRFERWLVPVLVLVTRPFFRHRLKLKQASRGSAKGQIDTILDAVAAMRRDGRRYLFGDRFTAADLTFAALAAPVLFPRGYGVALPSLEDLPDEMRLQIQRWRSHPAGIFAQRLYDERRGF
jgi:glutathione S-transferase